MKAAALLLLLALAAGAAAWLYFAHGPGFLELSFGGGAEPAPRAEWAPPPGAASPAIAGKDQMPWVRDERWQRGTDAGERGAELIALAYHDHFEVQGDPFLFRNRKMEAAKLLEDAIRDLESLRADFAHDGAAVIDVDPLLRKYREAFKRTDKR